MNKKTLIITLSSLAVLGAGVGTYLLLKRRKIRNLSKKDKLKLVYKSLQEDKDFGVSPIWNMKKYQGNKTGDELFYVNKYIKDFEKISFDNPTEATEYYNPSIVIYSDTTFPDKLLINFEGLATFKSKDDEDGFEEASFNGFIDLGLNTTITIIFYKKWQSSYQESNKNDELFRKKFSGRNSAVALKKVLEYLCSGKVYKDYEKYNIKLDKSDEFYNFCKKLK